MPIKTSSVDKHGRRVRPYVEYRFINIKASETPELLTEINEYWLKRYEAITTGYNRRRQLFQQIIEMTSTPEGESDYQTKQDVSLFEIEENLSMKQQVNKMIQELRTEGRIPPLAITRQFKDVPFSYLQGAIKQEIINRDALENIFKSLPSDKESDRKKEVRKRKYVNW